MDQLVIDLADASLCPDHVRDVLNLDRSARRRPWTPAPFSTADVVAAVDRLLTAGRLRTIETDTPSARARMYQHALAGGVIGVRRA